MFAVYDADYLFISVDVSAYGKSNDSSIFKESLLYKQLLNHSLNIPNPKPILSIEPEPMPYIIVGDEAFGLTENIMRPYGGNNLTISKKMFNYRLSRARQSPVY